MNTIYYNGQFKGPGISRSDITAVAVTDQRFVQFGSDQEIMQLKTAMTKLIDLNKKTVIPGLNDSHIHLIRGGLNFNMELRWDGVRSLGDALFMLKEQAARTPAPQWVRVVGGWTEFQFKERRMPTLDEINEASKETPVFLLHLYDRALLNRAALNAIGYNKNTKEMPGTMIQRDKEGNPTGMLIAHPNALILYSALAQGPKLSKSDQINSSLHFMRELNRLGITSVIDAGGGFQNYPEDYAVVQELDKANKLTVRIAYNLFTQNPGKELEDFTRWTKMSKYQQGNDYYRHNGAGEMLVFSAADFEDFLQPRPDLPSVMEAQLKPIVRVLAENKWPFRLHATYDESIVRALTVYEQVNSEVPFDTLHWFFDHAETISDQSIERVKKLGGGIAIQNRMAFQGEYFSERYGEEKTSRTPPISKILEAGVPVGMGTDATRVSSYNPWLCLYWLTTGKTIGGQSLYNEDNILSREKALELYTKGSAWFSNEEESKGSFLPNQFADFAVLSQDFFRVMDEDIKDIYSLMTVVGGQIVHACDNFSKYNPPIPPISPSWSPVKYYGGYHCDRTFTSAARVAHQHNHLLTPCHHTSWQWGGCFCWAF
ncbi:MAG: amidohydrolase [Legionellales bacterium]